MCIVNFNAKYFISTKLFTDIIRAYKTRTAAILVSTKYLLQLRSTFESKYVADMYFHKIYLTVVKTNTVIKILKTTVTTKSKKDLYKQVLITQALLL